MMNYSTWTGYGYDTAGRLSTLKAASSSWELYTGGGATRHCEYVPGTNRVASTRWNDGTNDFLEQDYTYDSYHRLTGIEDAVSYELNARDQRTQTTLQDGTYWQYAYDDLGQVTTAQRYDSAAEPILDGEYTYAYDGIGNRLESTEAGGSQVDYIANLLNQYTEIGTEEPTYDLDGNMLTHGGWSFTWNGENRLIQATNGTITVEADYDYLGRRIFKKVYEDNELTAHQRFLYDGYKLIEVRDALNANAVESTYIWQPMTLDVTIAMKRGNNWGYTIFDGNKNITKVVTNTGAELASYPYGPFGQTLIATGSWANLNPFRFSSEYHDDETGLVYYNYRHYSPELGRWISRDPAEEQGGGNLYGFLQNSPVNASDYLGLIWTIDRKGAATAAATTDIPQGESVASLAAAAGLLADEFDSWASNVIEYRNLEKQRMICAADVPNTIIKYWAGEVGGLGKTYTGWWTWFTDGFNYVDEDGNANTTSGNKYYELLSQYAASKALYATTFMGHGDARGNLYNSTIVVGADNKKYSVRVCDAINDNLPYKLNYINLNACYSVKNSLKNSAINFNGSTMILHPLPFGGGSGLSLPFSLIGPSTWFDKDIKNDGWEIKKCNSL